MAAERRFGRYVLQASLGTGGMAQVYHAVLPSGHGWGKSVALKRILAAYSEDQEFTTLLLEEARVTTRLSHPNIAQTFEVGEVDGTYYIALEFVDGPTLSSVLRRFSRARLPFPIDVALYIAMGVASGLHAAHNLAGKDGELLHLIHRDVSPHNIMLDRSGTPKLIDFGVAKARDRIFETLGGAVRGKLSFFSPERAEGDDFDHRADIFALGLVLWIMVTGDHPMKDLGQVETLMAMQQWTPPSIGLHRLDASPALGAVLQKMLAPNAEDRYSSGEEVRAALAGLLYEKDPQFSPLELTRFIERYENLPDISVELPRVRLGADGIVSKSIPEDTKPQPQDTPAPETPTPDVWVLDPQTDPDAELAEVDGADAEPEPTVEAASSAEATSDEGATSSVVSQEPDSAQRPRAAGDDSGTSRGDSSPNPAVSLPPAEVGEVAIADRPTMVRDPSADLPMVDRPTLLHEGDLDAMGDDRSTILHDGAVRPRPSIARQFTESRLWRNVRPQSRGAIFLLLGLMLVSGLFGAFVVALWDRDAKEPAARVSTSPLPVADVENLALTQLELSTVPTGAEILISGQPTGSTTPAVMDLPARVTSLELRRPGYQPKSVVVELQPGRRKVMTLELERAKVSAIVRLEPPSTAVLEFPDLHKRYLLKAGELVIVDGLRAGEEVHVLVQPDSGKPLDLRFTASELPDEEVVLRLDQD